MKSATPSSPQRVVTALTGGVPDTPPIALSLAMQASRITERPLTEILTDADGFVQAQLDMHARWQHDIAVGMLYAVAEAEAFGSDVIFYDDGPPNAGAPVITRPADIERVAAPIIEEHAVLERTLAVIRGMKAGLDGQALVAGVCVGLLSGPVMLMGMAPWLETLLLRPDHAQRMVTVYADFALRWAQAQKDAGADALIWFEPLLSPMIVPAEVARALALAPLQAAVAVEMPVVLHVASARAQGVVDLAVEAGAAVLLIGRFDDPAELRTAAAGRITLVGPLDGVSMVHWSGDDAADEARAARQAYDAPWGWIASDAHGEIPWNVNPNTVDVIVRTLRDGS